MSEELIAKREELRLKAKKLSTWTIYAWGIIGFSFVMAGYGQWAEVKVPYTDGIFYVGIGAYIVVRVFLKRDNDKAIRKIDEELAYQADTQT